ncbi:MAG: UDP-N-acetylglucosamine--N-acetylmuramyl-(pentapeptide) pyrophosphoryl-undecaprenol N-acetylglucosamine transferase [Planctomycetaceae bacterium]|nr:UDP-N-acetylglucosamine--N-acetylmuramyl-(pentapeptide) pyrophosphoryl-undecaprenol N-acetylglucosamine transferase [Planctomycetaceae bacterium]
MSGAIYIFAGGGTGGHIYPGLAVAEELLRLQPSAKIVFACSGRAIDRSILDPLPHAIVPQPVLPLPNCPLQVLPFVRAWWQSGRLARRLLSDLKPAAVLGLGGFAAAPLVVAAAKKGVRCAMLNPDGVPGRANRALARRAEVIFTQFDETTSAFPAALRAKVQAVGCPIRCVSGGSRQEAMAHFDLDPARKTLLVLGGSLGASNINAAVEAVLGDIAALGDQWQVLHVTGSAAGEELPGGKRQGPPVRRVAYCQRVDLAYAAADLALCRAGASTVAELAAASVPGVFMPYPYHRDAHQAANAAAMVRCGGAMICPDEKDAAANAANLRRCLLPLMADAAKLDAMRLAAGQVAKPCAAATVAQWLVRS